MIGVLGLQGAVAEHRRALADLGVATAVVRRPEELTGLRGLVIPGGESTTMSKLAIDLGLMEPIRAAIAGGLPALGTCAGLIMLADTVLDGRADQEQFGGLDIVTRRNAFGRQVDSYEEDLHIRQLGPQPVRAVFIRAPWVEQWGSEVEVLASVRPLGREHPVAVRQGNLLATSFHPEVTGDHRFHSHFVATVRGTVVA